MKQSVHSVTSSVMILLAALFITLMATSCSLFGSGPDFTAVNYSMQSADIGIAFPPTATTEQREFSLGHMDTLDMEWYRINQDWENREPTDDAFDWSPLNTRLTAFDTAGKKILLTLDLKNLPDWWVALSTDTDRVNEFTEFVTALLANFADDIDLIQFGNEWNWEIDSALGEYFGSHTESELDQLYIDMSNALYSAVDSHAGTKPSVVLGSVSIGGLQAISYSAGSISNVSFEYGNLYSQAELDAYDFDANRTRMENIIASIDFDYVDLHLYDEYWNWSTYINDFKTLIGDAGKTAANYSYIAGEFGGPHPELEPSGEVFAAERLLEYVKAIDQTDMEFALYFKLVEDSSSGAAHPNSYLVDEDLDTSYRYEQMQAITKP